jgi:hypothetical protein
MVAVVLWETLIFGRTEWFVARMGYNYAFGSLSVRAAGRVATGHRSVGGTPAQQLSRSFLGARIVCRAICSI